MDNKILIEDGKAPIKNWKTFIQKITESVFYAVRHPVKRHLYEIIKSRYSVKPIGLVTMATVQKHINLNLKSTK